MKADNLTYSALVHLAQAVDAVMTADFLTPRERVDLIGHWAYQYARPDMPQQLAAAIKRCQSSPDDLIVTASSRLNAVTGETVAYSGVRP